MFLDRLSGFRGMRASFEESIFSLAERQKGTFELVAVEQETKHQVVLGFFNMEDEVIVSWDELLVNLKTKFRGRTTLNLYARNNGTRKWFRLLSSRNSTMCHRFNDSDSLNVGGDRLFRIILNDQSTTSLLDVTKMQSGLRENIWIRWKNDSVIQGDFSLVGFNKSTDKPIRLLQSLGNDFKSVDSSFLATQLENIANIDGNLELFVLNEKTGEKYGAVSKSGEWSQLIRFNDMVAELIISGDENGCLTLQSKAINLPFLQSITPTHLTIVRPKKLLDVPLAIAIELRNGEHITYPFSEKSDNVTVPIEFFESNIKNEDGVKGIRATDHSGRVRGVISDLPAVLFKDSRKIDWLVSGNRDGRLNIARYESVEIEYTELNGTKLFLYGNFPKDFKVLYRSTRSKDNYYVLPSHRTEKGIEVDTADLYTGLASSGGLSGLTQLFWIDDTTNERTLPYREWEKRVQPIRVNQKVVNFKYIRTEMWQAQFLLFQSHNGQVYLKVLNFQADYIPIKEINVTGNSINFRSHNHISDKIKLILADKNHRHLYVDFVITNDVVRINLDKVKQQLDADGAIRKSNLTLFAYSPVDNCVYKFKSSVAEPILKGMLHSEPVMLTGDGLSMLRQAAQLKLNSKNEVMLNFGSWHNLQRRRFQFSTSLDYFDVTKTGYSFNATFKAKANSELKIDSIFLVNRNKLVAKSFDLETTSYTDSTGVHVTASFDPQSTFLPIYLDVFARGTYRGESVVIQVRHASDNVIRTLTTDVFDKEHDVLVKNIETADGDDYLNYLMYPYITINGNLAFEFRERKYFETPENQMLEMQVLQDTDALTNLKKKRFGDQQVWVVFEKNAQGGHDNGFHFFKYLYENHPEIQSFYVIEKESPDYQNLIEMSDRVLPYMSRLYFETLAISDLLIASDTRYHVYNTNRRNSLMGQILADKPLVYLQHGVNGLKQVPAFHKNRGLLNFLMVPDEYEKNMVVNQWGYSVEEVAVTGLARWDSYFDKTAEVPFKQIFVMPTWRKWMDGMTADRFVKTPFYKEYNSFLNSNRLKKVLLERNVRIAFFLHPYFKDYVHLFNVDDTIIDQYGYLDVDMGEEIMRSSMMISDYSSVLWDMYYLKKPVVFYQFDQAEYLETEKTYMNYETELFGDVAFNADEVIDEIIGYAGRDFAEKPRYRDMRQKYFTYMDQRNSERIYKAIVEKF